LITIKITFGLTTNKTSMTADCTVLVSKHKMTMSIMLDYMEYQLSQFK